MLSSYHTTASKAGFSKYCSSLSDSSFPILSSSFLLETKGSSLYLNVKMLHILSLTCFFSKFFVIQTELLTASHTREGSNSCLCFCYFLTIMFYPAYQIFVQPSRFKFRCFYFLDSLTFNLTSSVWFSPLYPHRTRVNIHFMHQLCVKVCAECWIPNHE